MSLRVLIVEDEFLIAWNAESVLQDAGIEVAGIATSFETAISLAEQTRPDLVLMDIVLASERDGVDAAIEFRKRLGTPCLFTSANHDADNRTRANAADPAGWLPKPYASDRLVQPIRAAAGPGSPIHHGSSKPV